jgi:glycosyltransferase involved in cell wall biosynthesis
MVQYMGYPTIIADGETGMICAAGEPAKYRFGVEYRGPHETVADGTCRAVRLNARALALTGLPVLLTSFSHTTVDDIGLSRPIHEVGLPDVIRAEVGTLRDASIGTVAIRVLHCVVHGIDHLRRVLMPASFNLLSMEELDVLLRTTVLYTVWERDRVDSEVAGLLNRVGQCWVPCEQNRDTLIASGVDENRVHVIPHPFETKSKIAQLVRRPEDFKPKGAKTKRFYSIGAWQPRKGYHELIGAFLKAFRPGDDACLTIKYSGGKWPEYPEPEQSIGLWLKHAQPGGKEIGLSAWTEEEAKKHIRLIGGRVSDDQILKLHFENNIYVSSSHGEAWNLGAFDAKVAGNSLIHVRYGGTEDFADPDVDWAIDHQMEPVPAHYKWEPGSQWATVNIDEIAKYMVKIGEDGIPLNGPRPEWFEEEFGIEAVGKKMRDLLIALAHKELKPEVAESLEQCGP